MMALPAKSPYRYVTYDLHEISLADPDPYFRLPDPLYFRLPDPALSKTSQESKKNNISRKADFFTVNT